MENKKEMEVKRKRGRPPLNKSIHENGPKYHLKAPQQAEALKEVITPPLQISPVVGTPEGSIEFTIKPTPEMQQAFDKTNDANIYAAENATKDVTNALADLTPVDEIEFVNGKNTLKIVLSKRHNRMYRVQVFLNNTMEIRPATYTGYSPASTFWGFLKEITKQNI